MREAIVRASLVVLLAAMRTAAQSTDASEVSAARFCAEGRRLYDQKKYAEAEARYLAGIVESEKSTEATTLRGACLVELARTQGIERKYVEAEANARRAVAIFERFPLSANLPSSRNVGLDTALIALGDALEDSGKYSEALAVVKRAWTLEVGNESDQSAQYRGIPFRQRLGRLYLKNKQYDSAAAILQENVVLLEKPRITGHTEVVPALNELAAVYIAQGKLNDAEVLLHRALGLVDKFPEEIFAETLLATLDEYAELLKRSGRGSEAKQIANRAKAIRDHYGDQLQ